MLLVIENSKTRIYRASASELQHLDLELKYPTDMVETLAKNPILVQEMKGWDGWYHCLHQPKTKPIWFPTGLVPRVERICRKMGFPVEVTDHRVKPDEGFPEFSPQPVIDRDYQIAAVMAALRLGRGVLDMPPRSGKTRCMVEIQRRLGLPTLWIAPTDRIVRQTQAVLASFFGDYYAIHLIGTESSEIASSAPVVVCTAATAVLLSPEFFKTREVLIIDEFHHAAAKTYRRAIFEKADHIYYRFGMTGTHYRSGSDAMAMHALLSTVVYKVSSRDLMYQGYLVPTRVVFLPVKSPRLHSTSSSYQAGTAKFGIECHIERNQLVVMAATQLYQAGKRVLVLVGTKRHGNELAQQISALLPSAPKGCRFKNVEFLSTLRDRAIQGEILESFLAGQEVKILIGTTLLGEGVDLPSADALVYARAQKAEVSVVQSAFRVGTATKSKREAIIVDFADRHNSLLMRHSKQRLEIYCKEPTFSVEVLSDANNFGAWLLDRGAACIGS